MVSLLAEKFVLTKRACLTYLLIPFSNTTFLIKMLMPEPGTKRQWNILCEEMSTLNCYVCCKSVSVYFFQLLIFQNFTVASNYFRILFSVQWIVNTRSLCLFYTVLLGQNFFVLWINCQPLNLFLYVMYVVFNKACAPQQNTLQELIWTRVSQLSVVSAFQAPETFLGWLEVRNKTYSW